MAEIIANIIGWTLGTGGQYNSIDTYCYYTAMLVTGAFAMISMVIFYKFVMTLIGRIK